MTRIPVLTLSVALVLGGLGWVMTVEPHPVAAATATATADLELREAPSAEAAVLAVVPAGSTLSLDGAPQGDYYPVTFNGTPGWVTATALDITKDAAIEPASEGGLEPTTEAAAQPTADPGAAPTAVPTDAAPIMSTEVPTLDAAVSPGPAATEAPAVEATAAAEPTAMATESATVAPTETPAPTATPVPPTATPFTVRSGPATAIYAVNLRAGPGSDEETLFLVPAGSTVVRSGRYVNGWLAVDFMGIAGWVEASALTEPLAVAPEPTPTPEPTPVPSPTGVGGPTGGAAETEPEAYRVARPGTGKAFATTDLSLRTGPSSSYGVMATIPAGTPVILTGVMENGFVRVEHDGTIGWVATEYLSMPADPTPATSPNGSESRRVYSREEIVRIIYAAADRYDQPRADMLRVAECESNLDPYAVNPSGSYGLFQFIRSTWESTPYGDRNVFDPQANANAAGWMWSVGRRSEWVCR